MTEVMTTSKSPRMVARVALHVGQDAFPSYSHKHSPRKFTQPRLFAILVLKAFCRLDYRGVRQLLIDCADLRAAIGLADDVPPEEAVPHYTTLQKASERLLKLPRVRRAMHKAARMIMGERRTNVRYAAVDSTGFEARHARAATTCTVATTTCKRARIDRSSACVTSGSGS